MKFTVEIPEVHYAIVEVEAISILDAIRKGITAVENGEELVVEFSHRLSSDNAKVYNDKGELVY